jgi:two-component system response regulator MprA
MDKPSMRVLAVDDDPAVLRLIRLVLLTNGFEICTAVDGVDALQRMESCHPDVIVLDMHMPRMDGRTLYRSLRSSGCSTPVLVLTADGSAAAARELGAQGHLAKPFAPEDLREALKSAMASGS